MIELMIHHILMNTSITTKILPAINNWSIDEKELVMVN